MKFGEKANPKNTPYREKFSSKKRQQATSDRGNSPSKHTPKNTFAQQKVPLKGQRHDTPKPRSLFTFVIMPFSNDKRQQRGDER